MNKKTIRTGLLALATVLLTSAGCRHSAGYEIRTSDGAIVATTEHYQIVIHPEGFRYSFHDRTGRVIAGAHPASGLQIGRDPESLRNVIHATLKSGKADRLIFDARTDDGTEAEVELDLQPHRAKIAVNVRGDGEWSIVGRTAGLSPAFGLADHGAVRDERDYLRPPRDSSDVTGFRSDYVSVSQPRLPFGRGIRMGSNFVVFPRHGFATVNVEPMPKIVRVTEEENAQGVRSATSMPALYYLIGSPPRIYQSLHEIRAAEGYPFMKPKYGFFGLGWEAWGALAWDTNAETVRENVQTYLDLGFPLEWMVIGSGFWPREKGPEYIATTSFGMWDETLYPNPRQLIERFREQGLRVFLGLRITFTAEGPYTMEGLRNGYFVKDETGEARIIKTNFPRTPVYLLDAQNPEAVDWYVGLCEKWIEYGIEGFKEDFMDRPEGLRDDLIDPVNEALMKREMYVMGRNMYLGSPADLHRYDDFNFDQNQDRGPINGLALAYTGFPYVYPDVIGGTKRYFADASPERIALYLMRFAEYSALNPAMAMGFGPWQVEDPRVVEVVRDAAWLHHRLRPYTYSYAIKAYQTGFPWTMVPLPLAYPEDPEVYGLDIAERRSYQWMIGESLLATPLYGDDYATASTRDVYLPEGSWIEYDSGERHEGPVTLKDYPLPIGKTPLFVGGPGIVIEETEGELMGRLYPVSNDAEMVFYGREGEVRNRITIESPDWDAPSVIEETTGEAVAGEWSRHAYEFVLSPGADYRVR